MSFVSAVHTGKPFAIERGERIIPIKIAKNMLSAFFIMPCRNPSFDAMGVYSSIKNNVLYPTFKAVLQDELVENSNTEAKTFADELMEGIWYSELYRMFYKRQSGLIIIL